MGNRLSKISSEKECLICWENIENKNIYVKCDRCRIYLHTHCAYSYCIQKSMKKCPHCQWIGSLYYYNDEKCHIL